MRNTINTILHCVDSRGIGGIETHILTVCKALIAAGENASVLFVKRYGPHPFEKKLVAAGIPFSYANGVKDMLQTLRRYRPKVLHTHGYKANLAGRMAAVLFNIPVVASFHAGERCKGKLALYQALDRITARPFVQIAISSQIAETLKGDVTILDNFMALDRARAELDSKTCIFLGRLSEEKGPDRFLNLAKRHPDITFRLYGHGPMREALEVCAPENLVFEGATSSPREALLKGSLLVLPSRYEGLPMAALEAMAVGLPIAAFGVGALPRVIIDGQSGFCVSPDQEDQLSDAIGAYFDQTLDQRREMAQLSRLQLVQHFSPEAKIPYLIAVYERALFRQNREMSLATST